MIGSKAYNSIFSAKKTTSILRFIGMIVLYVFFYMYAVGKAIGYEELYYKIFYVAIAISALILLLNKHCLVQYGRYYAWQFCFILMMMMSVLYTYNTENGGTQLSIMFKILLKVTTVAIICGNFAGIKKLLAGFSIIGGSIFFTLYFTGNLFEGWRLGTELMGNSNSFALIVAIMMTGSLFYLFNPTRPIFNIINFIIIILELFMLFLTGGRKFLLYVIVFSYSSMLISASRSKAKNILFVTIIIIAAVAIMFYLIMNVEILYNSIGIRIEGIGTAEGAMGVDDQSFLMSTGLQMFSQKPLFGWGIASFQQYYLTHHGIYFYAHSNYIELLSDYGIVGTILYYSQYLYCFVTMWKYRKNMDAELKLFLPLLVSITVLDFFANTFNQTAFVPLLIMFISGYTYKLKHGYIKKNNVNY